VLFINSAMQSRAAGEDLKYQPLGLSSSVLDFAADSSSVARASPAHDVLFCKDVPTRLHVSHRDERVAVLTTQINMISPANNPHSQAAAMRVLQFQLTDPVSCGQAEHACCCDE